jgi:transcriptional regulator with XRE-family HTH domain
MRIIATVICPRTAAGEENSPVQIQNIVGARVRQARLASKPSVSQEDLSGRLAREGILITQTGISKLENRERYLMDYEVQALAKVLKVSVAWLYGEESSNKANR